MSNYSDIGYDSKLRKIGSLAQRPREAVSALEQDERYEKSPYAPPTFVSKGTVQTTAGGLVDLLDKTGGTSVFTYDPNTGSITILGYLSISNPITFGSSTTIGGNLTVAGTTTLNGPGTVNNNALTFNSTTNGSAALSLRNASGVERLRAEITNSGFGFITADQWRFTANQSNTIFESFGVVTQLADSNGVHSFKIRDNRGTTLWYFASNGEVYQGVAKFFELKGNTPDPGNAGADKVRLYVDESGGKNRLMARFESGTAVQVAIEP